MAILTSILAAAPATAPKELSIWQLCLEGGFIMIPLALLSLVCIYIFVERAIVVNAAAKEDDTFMKRIKGYIHEGEIESAINLCNNNGSPYARLVKKGISRIGRPMNDVLVAIENAGNIEVANLGKGLSWLATTAAGAPMLGFLGTVIGMVQAFLILPIPVLRQASELLPMVFTPHWLQPLPVSSLVLSHCLLTTTWLLASIK